MHSNALPIAVERHLPLLPMGLVSPACCWASIDDDLNYIFHIANGRGTVSTENGVIRFCAPCAVIVPAGEAHNLQFELNASGMALTITGNYLESLVAREPDFAMLFAAPVIGKLTDRFGKLRVYRIIAPVSAVLMLTITVLPRASIVIAVVVFGSLMVSNVGRMIAAMAMITGSVDSHRRGGFLSANSSVQHIASGVAAYLGGIIILQTADGRIEHFGKVGLIAAIFSMSTLWLAGRVRRNEQSPVAAERLSLAAAAEASVDDPEPMVVAAEGS